MSEWQNMNSAPYDKTWVALIFTDGGFTHYGVGWYMPLMGWQGWDFERSPTQWMLLPPPPVTEESCE